MVSTSKWLLAIALSTTAIVSVAAEMRSLDLQSGAHNYSLQYSNTTLQYRDQYRSIRLDRRDCYDYAFQEFLRNLDEVHNPPTSPIQLPPEQLLQINDDGQVRQIPRGSAVGEFLISLTSRIVNLQMLSQLKCQQ